MVRLGPVWDGTLETMALGRLRGAGIVAQGGERELRDSREKTNAADADVAAA